MEIKIEKADGLFKHVKITIPVAAVETEFQKKLAKAQSSVKIAGFRPGKVPLKVVEQRFGVDILNEVAMHLMEQGYRQALTEQKLMVAGAPSIESSVVKRHEPLTFTLKVECFPEIVLKDLKNQAIEKTTAEVTEEDVDTMLETLRGQHKNWSCAHRPAKMGDLLIIDFEGFLDGSPFEGGKAESYRIELGSHSMIPGFEEALVGFEEGDERTITVTFPADYHAQNLAGKKSEFKIKCHHVEAAHLPELNDEFADKNMRVKEGGLAKLRVEVRKNMERELKGRLKESAKNAVLDKLLEINKVEVPQSALDAEIKHMQQITRQRMAQQFGKQANLDKFELPRDLYEKQAHRRVALGMLLAEVIKAHQLKPDAERVRVEIESMAGAYDSPQEVINYYYKNERLLSDIQSMVLEDMAVEKLLENAKVSEKKVNYQEAVKPQAQEG